MNKVRPGKYTRTIKYAVGKLFETLELRNQDPANLLQEIRKLEEATMKNIPKKRIKKSPNWLTEELSRL
jgi:hypothetical protein